jgi:hypothetical protein
MGVLCPHMHSLMYICIYIMYCLGHIRLTNGVQILSCMVAMDTMAPLSNTKVLADVKNVYQ